MQEPRIPLNYALVMYFATVEQDCAEGVAQALRPTYGSHKMLDGKAVVESLATACENGLLEERAYDALPDGQLRIHYALTDFGSEAIAKYLD